MLKFVNMRDILLFQFESLDYEEVLMPYIFFPIDRERIKMLLTMDGIDSQEQERLWRLGTDVSSEEAKRFADLLVAKGATYRHTLKEVDAIFGNSKSFWSRLLGL
jgi:hypothetical protein